MLQAQYGQTGSNLSADLNDDNVVNIFDLSILADHWTGDGVATCQPPA
jgi:hypothetical protein